MLGLKSILKGKVIILCIGNRDRGDDGAGPYLADLIKGKVPYEVIDAGIVPENWTGRVRELEPDIIIIVDTVYFEGVPGEARLFSGEDICSGKISTHDVSPKLLIEYLSSTTDACIYVLGINPGSNKFGKTLSKEVRDGVRKIVTEEIPLTG